MSLNQTANTLEGNIRVQSHRKEKELIRFYEGKKSVKERRVKR